MQIDENEKPNIDPHLTSDRIFELAAQCGITSDFLIARACGVTHPAVSNWRKSGPVKIHLSVAVNFCRSQHISYKEFLGEDEDPTEASSIDDQWNLLNEQEKGITRYFWMFLMYLRNLGINQDFLDKMPVSGPTGVTPSFDMRDFIRTAFEEAEKALAREKKEWAKRVAAEGDADNSIPPSLVIKDASGREYLFEVSELDNARRLIESIRESELLKTKPYIKIKEGMELYSLGEEQLINIAKEAGAFYKFSRSTIICREDLERHLREKYLVKPEDNGDESPEPQP